MRGCWIDWQVRHSILVQKDMAYADGRQATVRQYSAMSSQSAITRTCGYFG